MSYHLIAVRLLGDTTMPESTTPVTPVLAQIGEVTLGGNRGEYPTALMLSTFHTRDRVVSDHKTGRFDRRKVTRYLTRALELSQTTGNPLILDVLAETPVAMEAYLSYLSEVADSVPFLIDSSSEDARLAGIKYVHETGRAQLAVYDAISHYTTDEELNALHDAKIHAAIILAHNPLDIRPQGRLDVLKGTPEEPGLLQKAQTANISNLLVDTVALDLAGLSLAATAMKFVKREFGLPVGAGSANSVALWEAHSRPR